MAGTATLNVRMDAETKREFTEFCEELGMSASSLMNVFARTVVRNREVPFALTTRTDRRAGYERLFPKSQDELARMLDAAAATPLSDCTPMNEAMASFEERLGW